MPSPCWKLCPTTRNHNWWDVLNITSLQEGWFYSRCLLIVLFLEMRLLVNLQRLGPETVNQTMHWGWLYDGAFSPVSQSDLQGKTYHYEVSPQACYREGQQPLSQQIQFVLFQPKADQNPLISTCARSMDCSPPPPLVSKQEHVLQWCPIRSTNMTDGYPTNKTKTAQFILISDLPVWSFANYKTHTHRVPLYIMQKCQLTFLSLADPTLALAVPLTFFCLFFLSLRCFLPCLFNSNMPCFRIK